MAKVASEGLRDDMAMLPTYSSNVWFAVFTLPNLPINPDAERGPKAVYEVISHCLTAFNGFMHAYLVATEMPGAHFLQIEGAGSYALMRASKKRHDKKTNFAGIAFLPSATMLNYASPISAEAVDKRYEVTLSYKGRHPIDQVITWRLRAEQQADIYGDYEMSVIAYNTAAERLISSVWGCIEVENPTEAARIAEVNKKFNSGYSGVFRRFCLAFDVEWWDGPAQPQLRGYWRDLYGQRNAIAHEGRLIDAKAQSKASVAFHDLWKWTESATAAERRRFPRTALLVNSWLGLKKLGLLDDPVRLAIDNMLRDGRAHDFWLS